MIRIPKPLNCLAMVALLLLPAACTSSTPYQPLSMLSPATGGYTDEQLGPDRFRVDFFGNTLTSRERVETYLLFRAAQLTVEQGADWFVVVDHEMEHQSEIVVRPLRPDPTYRPAFSAVYGDWRPYWRYQNMAGWTDWDPYHGDPFWADQIDPQVVESFHATAEIKLGRGSIPVGEDKAMAASDVIRDIGPRVKYPEE